MEEKFRENLENLLQVNLKINSLLKSDKFKPDADEQAFADFRSEIEILLSDKDSCIKSLAELKRLSEKTFSEFKNSKYQAKWQNVQELEKENLNIINQGKTEVSREISGIAVHSKAISFYKSTNEVKPRLFDDQL